MKRARLSYIVSGLVLSLAATNASAATVDLAYLNVSPGQVESVSTNSGVNFNQQNAGLFNFNASNKSAGVSAVIPGSTVATWCIELSQNVDAGTNTYTVLGPGFGPYIAPYVNTAAMTAFFNQFYSPAFTIDQATAFQLAIWELEFDNTPGSLSAGLFQVSGNDLAVQQGNAWLAAFDSNTAGPWVLFQLANDTFQDQIFAVQGGGTGQNPTPLPTPMIGGLALLAGLGICAKVRRAPAAV